MNHSGNPTPDQLEILKDRLIVSQIQKLNRKRLRSENSVPQTDCLGPPDSKKRNIINKSDGLYDRKPDKPVEIRTAHENSVPLQNGVDSQLKKNSSRKRKSDSRRSESDENEEKGNLGSGKNNR
jgi:hypothetical protein